MENHKVLYLALFFLILLSASSFLARAAPPVGPHNLSANYSIPWWSVDNGGGVSQGGSYRLSGTIGQADAAISTGGTFTLRGGFWSGSFSYTTFVPLLRR